MSGKVFKLTVAAEGVSMALNEFILLGTELQIYGVDVEIQPESKPGVIIFKLKEMSRDQ